MVKNFDLKRPPFGIRQQTKILLDGSFVERRENLLAFGNPGSGKTHLLCGICHELARRGRRVYFSTCDLILQQLLRAKRELEKAVPSNQRLDGHSIPTKQRQLWKCCSQATKCSGLTPFLKVLGSGGWD